MNKEKESLDSISKVSGHTIGANINMVSYTFSILKRYLCGEKILELGPAEGVMTEQLVGTGKDITVVEGAAAFCHSIEKRFPRVHVNNLLFEEFEPKETFDTIILGHVLEHVQDPVDILVRVGRWLTPQSGRIFAAVPNARSLHRQAAVIMGLLPIEDALNEADIQHGHRRVFSPESFRACFQQAGLKIEVFGGYWLKPVSNKQIEDNWSPEMLQAFMQLGERYPDIAAENYIVAKH